MYSLKKNENIYVNVSYDFSKFDGSKNSRVNDDHISYLEKHVSNSTLSKI
jgi:hypothetical protein